MVSNSLLLIYIGVSCKCPAEMIKDDPNRFPFNCTACADTEGPNEKQTECLECDTSNGNMQVLNGQCVCAAGFRAATFNDLGALFTNANGENVISCLPCPAGEFRGPATKSIWQCEACPDPNQEWVDQFCICKDGYQEAGDTCITNAQRDELLDRGFIEDGLEYKIDYNNIKQVGREGVSSVTEESDVFKYYYLQSAVGCTVDQDLRQCQILANLCVLQLYNEKTIACRLFKELQKAQTEASEQVPFYKDEGWRKDLPWLYYTQTPAQVFNDAVPVDLTVSFSGGENTATRTNQLKFWLARYTIDGLFESM